MDSFDLHATSDHRNGWLQLSFRSINTTECCGETRICEVAPCWITNVDERNENRHNPTNVNCLLMISLWDLESWSWNCLRPAQTGVGGEHAYCKDVKSDP